MADQVKLLLNVPQKNNEVEVEQMINPLVDDDINMTDRNGNTPLYMAAENGHHEVVAALINARAVDLAEKDGSTPLYMAAENGHHEVVAALINARANVDLAAKDGSTPLLHGGGERAPRGRGGAD